MLFRKIGEKPLWRFALQLLALAAVSFLQAFQMHYSTVDGIKHFFTLPFGIILLNVGILLWLNLLAKLLLQKWHFSILLTTVLTTVWSIVNFFVLKFHGSPLFFSEFENMGTALNVIDGYKFVWERRITWLLLLGLLGLAAAAVLWLCRKRKARFFILRDFLICLAAFAGTTALLYLSLFVWQKPKPRETISWTWREGVYGYGYVPIIVEDVDRSIHFLVVPEGYDKQKLEGFEAPAYQEPQMLPDVVLIINETFCDLSDCLTFTTDVDYMAAFYGIDGATCGKAIIPNIGGGTNNTEYEVMTSNSMHLLTKYAPFNYVNMNKDEGNVARYLKSLGYTSAALHCEPGSNYSRNRAYPNMGFDKAIMGNKNFVCRKYGKRRNLDEDNYQDMIKVGQTLGDGPRLLYLLTFQNHGGWETNDESFDTVHVQENFGDMTDDLNEFLTSIRMSCEAFRGLTEYYAASDRPTVVLMVGDHAPSFISKMAMDKSLSSEEKQIRRRTVPYVIWANFDLDLPEQTDYATAVDLLPMVYRAAGIPTSAYHNYILSLHDKVPVRTTSGCYMDADGKIGLLEGSPYYDLMQTYYYLEYNNVNHGSDYRRELFVLPGKN